MQIANCFVALGGDKGNAVPRYGVTPGEIVVLFAIHGDEAVFDIEPAGEVERSGRDELRRIREVYSVAKDENGAHIVGKVFPGTGARVPTSLEELEISPVLFKALSRVTAATAPAVDAQMAAAATPVAIADEDGLAEIQADDEPTPPSQIEAPAPKPEPTVRNRRAATAPSTAVFE